MAALATVQVSSDALCTLLGHALTSDAEEVMGLLLGDVDTSPVTGAVARVLTTAILQRSHREKDRVEISPEQLAEAQSQAERTSRELGVAVRVIGWYHSHPHITVQPSHVDVQTQASYQQLDRAFVGLIVACFDEQPAERSGRLQVIAFQADAARMEALTVPVAVMAPPATAGAAGLDPWRPLVELQRVLLDEERYQYAAAALAADHPVARLHTAAIFEKAICRQYEVSTAPLLAAVHQQLKESRALLLQLQEEKARLAAAAAATTTRSPPPPSFSSVPTSSSSLQSSAGAAAPPASGDRRTQAVADVAACSFSGHT